MSDNFWLWNNETHHLLFSGQRNPNLEAELLICPDTACRSELLFEESFHSAHVSLVVTVVSGCSFHLLLSFFTHTNRFWWKKGFKFSWCFFSSQLPGGRPHQTSVRSERRDRSRSRSPQRRDGRSLAPPSHRSDRKAASPQRERFHRHSVNVSKWELPQVWALPSLQLPTLLTKLLFLQETVGGGAGEEEARHDGGGEAARGGPREQREEV